MSTTIDTLPEDVLLTIFSYCSHHSLVTSIQYVCRRWQQVSRSRSLWNYIVYKPDGHISKAHITEMLKLSPKLQVVDLSEHIFISEEVFRILGDHCPDLRVLRLCERTNVELSVFRYLITKCPSIEEITAPLDYTDFRMLNIFTGLVHLKTLIVKTTFASFGGLSIISSNFPNLEHLELQGVEVSNSDLECLIKNKKHQLHTLRIPCIMRDGSCVLPHLSVCKKLKSLSLDSSCRTLDKQPEALPVFKNISSLTIHGGSFSSDVYCAAFFRIFCQVVKLQISFCEAYDDGIIEVIARHCPLIQKLTFDGGFVSDETLRRLHSLKQLRCLTIRWYSDITDSGLKYLHNVSGLMCLRFFQCGRLTGESVDILSHFRKLQILEFYQCRGMFGITQDTIRMKLPHVRVTLNN